jgi:hypothetical protein
LGYYRNKPKELKTHAFINGDGGWSKIDAAERKAFLGAVCDLVAECARIFAVAFSFEKFDPAANAARQERFLSSRQGCDAASKIDVSSFCSALAHFGRGNEISRRRSRYPE